ncbi:hypothetical protein PsYK624_117700 [Phanerochaete sordida]|uniref:Uncharacterized protein n=1 Tax=Phanerochaete sordida TaxID=48140 RepID=A0A9P3GLC9_9APHY|nr:hypothetical protein PsYK624_117700 [Phanerochaete sordida]
MELDIWFSDPDIEVESLPWDALEPLLDPAHAKFLCFTVAPGGQYHSVKRLMCAVLRRTRLAWALNRGLLHFCKHRHPDRRPLSSLSCADINVVPAEHAVDGHALTLDTEEQAEWLLRIFQGSGRDAYLRELVAARMVDGGGGGESPRDELVLASRMSGRAAGN